MCLPTSFIDGGRFSVSVSGGVAAAVNVACIGEPDLIIAVAITGWGEASDAQAIEWWWERGMGNGYANGILQSSEGSTPQLPAMTSYRLPATGTTAVDAISIYNTFDPPVYAGLATTAITSNAGTFICTMANTGSIAVGDYVKLYSTTGALQLSLATYQVTAVTANTSITLGYVASSGITTAAAATAGTVVKFIPGRMYPRRRFIMNITKAAQAVVYFSEKNDFSAGEIVSFRVPSQYGMTQINNKQVRILSVTNSASISSITLDLDTTGYSTFSLPTTAQAAAGVSPAVCMPSSSGIIPFNGSATVPQEPPGTNLQDAFDNRNVNLIRFGAALFNVSAHVSDDGDIWMWEAYKYDNYRGLVTSL